MTVWTWILAGTGGLLVLIAAYDLLQRKHAILRNFPVVGHLRYLLETVGPELRQYIVTDNDEERPFSRDQRRWVYASAKKQNTYFGFGTDNDLETSAGYLVIKQSQFPIGTTKQHEPHYRIPCAKVLGEYRGRAKAFRMSSVVNISAMSFGSLSANAIEALNRGAAIDGCLHNTGEGGVSSHHLHGGDLVWQIGTGYFGCRDANGRFSKDKLLETLETAPVRALEIKLSQGAKPGMGGLLPKAKITAEISRIRGIPRGVDCASPASHSEFSDVSELLDFVEDLAESTGLPVGIKSAVGQMDFWHQLAEQMATTGRAVDYIAIDGGEGGTGASPLVFADHVAMPFKLGFSRVYRALAERELTDHIVLIGSGKLGFPQSAAFAFALGCDAIAVAREPMLAVGCIQAQRCHTGHCPTGVATQSAWLMRGLHPTDKAARLANYVSSLRKELLHLSHACGVSHPALLRPEYLELLDHEFGSRSIRDVFGYEPGHGTPSDRQTQAINELMRAR